MYCIAHFGAESVLQQLLSSLWECRCTFYEHDHHLDSLRSHLGLSALRLWLLLAVEIHSWYMHDHGPKNAVSNTACIPPPVRSMYLTSSFFWHSFPACSLLRMSADMLLAPAENMHPLSLSGLRSQRAMPQATAVMQMLRTGGMHQGAVIGRIMAEASRPACLHTRSRRLCLRSACQTCATA